MKEILNRNLRKYIIPSMIITMLGVFHNIIDGFFIGQHIGDTGLAAANLSLPIVALINSIAIGIGIGGAVTLAISQGQNNMDKSKKAMGNTITLLVLAAIILTVLISIFKGSFLRFLGANETILPLAIDYIRILALGSIFQILTLGTNPLIRNIDEPIRAMLFIIAGLVLNMFLNNVFVNTMGLGLTGVALATILGQSLSALLSLFNIAIDRHQPIDRFDLRLDGKVTKEILKLSTSSFGSAFLPYAVIVLTNWQIIKYGGNHALAAYSILSYASQIVASMLQGIGYGAQPLISFYNGSGKVRLIKYLKKKTLKTMVLFSGIAMLIAIVIRDLVPIWFNASSDAAAIIEVDMIISSIAFIPSAIVKFSHAYFYALNKPKTSNILIYLELLFITPLLLYLLPLTFGLNGVWYTTPVSQIILAIIAYNLLKTDNLKDVVVKDIII